MRAAILGALGALAAIALSGCAAEGVQSPTEAHSASVSPDIRKVADIVVGSDTDRRLQEVGARFEDKHCEVHLRRQDATSEWAECFQANREIGSYAGKLYDSLSWARPWPAAVEDVGEGTVEALKGLMAASKSTDPQQMKLSLAIYRGAVESWSAVTG